MGSIPNPLAWQQAEDMFCALFPFDSYRPQFIILQLLSIIFFGDLGICTE